MLSLLLACSGSAPESVDTAVDSGCALDAAPVTPGAGEAENRVAWQLTGTAASVEATAAWYDGAVVSRTLTALSGEGGAGEIAWLPYATGSALQEAHGGDITLSLVAWGDDGSLRCEWRGAVPFFSPDWTESARPPQTVTVSEGARESFDQALSDRYLLQPQKIADTAGDEGVVFLLNAVGDVVGRWAFGRDLLADFGVGDAAGTELAGVDLRQGRLSLVTAGYPDLSTAALCRYEAASAAALDCTDTGRLFHHGLALSEDGAYGLSPMWVEGPSDGSATGVSAPARFPLDAPSDEVVAFDLQAMTGASGVYENSISRSPVGSDGQTMSCTTAILSWQDGEGERNLEIGICYPVGADGALASTEGRVVVNDADVAYATDIFSDEEVAIFALPSDDSDRRPLDFIHDVKMAERTDGTWAFVYSLGFEDSARVSVFRIKDAEREHVCTAELLDDGGSLYFGSVLLPSADALVFGAYAAMEEMVVRWYDLGCQEIGVMQPAGGSATGIWTTMVDAGDLYPEAVSHQIHYQTVSW